VTGTRIRSPNVQSIAPVVAVSDEEVKLEGTTNVEKLLNNLPQITADQTNTQSNGGTGTATVDLRALGVNRTLVLIDGKRLGPGDASGGTGAAADLDFIPATLVSGVEVLTGGASTDYGSDALSGVVNFKMKRDFEGIELDQQFGAFQHDQQNGLAQGLLSADGLQSPGNQLDGTSRTSTIIAGANGANGKSNVTLYLTDAHTDPVLQASRDFSNCDITGGATALKCTGSVNSPQGLFFPNVAPATATSPAMLGLGAGPESTTNPNGTASLVPGTVDFNFNPLNFLQRSDQRYTAGGFAHDEIMPWLDVYTDFGFLDDKSTAQIAPGGLFGGSGGPAGTFQVNCNNPFLGASEQTSFGCGSSLESNGQVTIIAPGLRFAGIPRQDNLEHTDYRIVVGARGDLPYGFNYDASVTYWQANYSDETAGFASFTKTQDALLVTTNTAGQPVCISGNPGCIPLNIFSRNGAAGAGEQSVLTNSLITGTSTEVVAGMNVSGDLGAFGVKSPLAADPVSVVLGYEYRFENVVKQPDQENQTDDLIGSGGTVLPVNGSFDDNDFYGELHAPLVQDLPFAKAVDLDLGLRHSGYDVYGTNETFDTNTYKIQGDWQITNDVKLRGGYNRAARAPNTFELFNEDTVGLTTGFDDPCSSTAKANGTLASVAACERTGLTAAQVGNVADCPAAQCSELTGGNTALKPEEADTYTWGIVYTPTYLPNFNFSMDYFTIDIANAIEDLGVPANISLDQCIAGPSPLCANVHRGAGGILFGQTAFITATTVNAARLTTDGIDFSASYKHDLDFIGAGDMGSLVLSFTGTYTASLTTTPFPGAASFDCAGLFGVTCGEPTPAWRHIMRATWVSPWDANLSLNWRHLSSVAFDGNQSSALLNIQPFNTVTQGISSFDYFDLSGTWQVAHNLEIRAGVNNIFDRDPPIVDANIAGPGDFGNANTYPGVYDSLGREFFVGATMKF
jgi:outer membrane receptor protein involved in Fe transport